MNKPVLAVLLALVAAPAFAQYKVVGPDGKVTYTDRPPPATTATPGRVQTVNADGGAAAALAQLPYALRQVAAKFPVVLYTAADCRDACGMGRAHLAKRGIPFSERTVDTAEERDAWPRLVGGTEAPVLKVGNQSLRGFSPSAWDETLDVAGYPKESQLPANYKAPAATPLIEKRVDTAAKAAPPPPAPVAPTDPSTNPTGIRF